MLLLCREAVAPGQVVGGVGTRQGRGRGGGVGKVNAPQGNAMQCNAVRRATPDDHQFRRSRVRGSDLPLPPQKKTTAGRRKSTSKALPSAFANCRI